MLVSLSLNEEEEALVTKFAESNNITISELVHQAIFRQIENSMIEEKLDEADEEAASTNERLTAEEVFLPIRKKINV